MLLHCVPAKFFNLQFEFIELKYNLMPGEKEVII